MTRAQWFALVFGVLLLSAPLIRAEEEEYEDEAEEEADAGSSDEKDVVVITTANFDEKVKKSKFALVRGGGGGSGWAHRCGRGAGRPIAAPIRLRFGGWGRLIDARAGVLFPKPINHRRPADRSDRLAHPPTPPSRVANRWSSMLLGAVTARCDMGCKRCLACAQPTRQPISRSQTKPHVCDSCHAS